MNPTEANNMKNLILSSALVLVASAAAQAQEAVQWRVQDGGNGHWYQVRRAPSPICWDAASELAATIGGYLATITTSQEHGRVTSLAAALQGPATELGPWIGATCSGRPWGEWYWVTGEPFAYHGWLPSAPNPGWNEEYVHLWRWLDGRWNDGYRCGTDAPTTVHGYVIEWSADCNGDGIVDYGQILQGQLVDADANGVPDVCEVDPCPGDITNGGLVDAVDLSVVLAAWGTDGQGKFNADIDNSGLVDGGDLALVLGGWGPCPQ